MLYWICQEIENSFIQNICQLSSKKKKLDIVLDTDDTDANKVALPGCT